MKQIDEIDCKRTELTRKHNIEMDNIKEGIKQMKIEELPQQFQEALMKEIRYSFDEKWKMYRKEMEKLDIEISDLKRYY